MLNEVGDGADFQAMLGGKHQQVGQAGHGAVVIHDLANHGGGRAAGQGRQQMFNGGQAPRAELQSRAQLGVAHLARLQAQQRQLGGIEPADPVDGRFTGLEPHPGVLATMQTHAIALHRAGQGPGLGVITRPRAHQNFQPTPRLKRQLPERSWLATSRRSGPTGVVTIRPVPTEKPWPGLPSRPPGLPGTLA